MKNTELGQRVKELRQRKGLSQEELAERSGLSLRTIQRVEAGESEPRGDTLKRLAETLDATPDQIVDWAAREDRRFLAGMNLSALAFIAFPVLGIILPLILWISKKDKVKNVDETAKKILNFQITWLLLSIAIMILFGFGILHYFTPARIFSGDVYFLGDITPSMFIGPFAIVMLGGLWTLYNILFIVVNTVRINNIRRPVYFPSIRFIR